MFYLLQKLSTPLRRLLHFKLLILEKFYLALLNEKVVKSVVTWYMPYDI